MAYPAQNSSNHSKSRSIPFPAVDEKYKLLLSGEPETAGMKSGYVVLLPGESVGLHSTEDAEEVVIPFSGTGELRVPGQEPVHIYAGFLLYNPPHTPHDVVNTGDQELRYVYVVAKTR